jgi:DNA-binding LytR/AlgR family response regulator
VGRVGEEYFILNGDEVYAFQAEGDLVWIITAKRKYLATQTLKVLQERLQDTSFRRIHRNADDEFQLIAERDQPSLGY